MTKKFNLLNEISFSWWNITKKISRKEVKYNLIECINCNHVRCVGDYSKDMIHKFYSNDERFAISSKPKIFKDIIKFNLPFLKNSKKLNIVDFGGADGTFLKVLNKNEKLKNRINGLTVCDYLKNKKIPDYINSFKIDLDSFKNWGKKIKIDYGFCIHTLEHLQNPKQFLTNLYRSNDNFFLYIEVPAIEILDIEDSITVIHPEHINYFTLQSLSRLVNDVGFKIIKTEYTKTEGVPRLKLLAERSQAQSSLSAYIEKKEEIINFIKNISLEKAEKYKVGFWGIGNEFWLLIKKFPELKKMIKDRKFYLIDTNLKGKILFNTKIYDPKKLPNDLKFIVILPFEAYVVDSIKRNARKSGIKTHNIINPYAIFSKSNKN